MFMETAITMCILMIILITKELKNFAGIIITTEILFEIYNSDLFTWKTNFFRKQLFISFSEVDFSMAIKQKTT